MGLLVMITSQARTILQNLNSRRHRGTSEKEYEEHADEQQGFQASEST